ncbi:tyrosyl-tRNA synthetase [Paenibacillus sp. FSL R7-0273]|uniref:tyrosine--tRNA ligase n=1 Tax=Paenibacillus sp. FSL R7-0273 TaxID=1536772 RepID=UPI0004F87557|nr:tyrosine--tRNA ligase [Paenibacillus sp. FSL R7-0273]AIQ46763.1 tyrosyl-tRNA synthetase [Paenibacillus sp. FSL R7-0273]OMF97465.1 tyrosine--tRNA ligase [Paenibacillus sp. FSL R7-0273]
MKWEELTPAQQQEVERQLETAVRGAAEIIPVEQLRSKLVQSVATGTPLNIKLGLDPSAPDIHIGHTVVLHKLRQFQEAGHQVQLIIGDFTGRIGDPTGKSETRRQLSEEDVQRNAATYRKQIFKILDPDKTKVLCNSDWLSPMNFAEVVNLAAKVTVARMMERDDFTKRFQGGQAISVHEFFYPLMQGMDSVANGTDIEIGGTDQKFNILMGRTLQKEYGEEPQAVVLMPLLEGLDGVKKMSKSLGNYIGIDEAPNEMYGKTMSVPDELMLRYYEMATDLSNSELAALSRAMDTGAAHPRDVKMRLAHTLVRMYHGAQAADAAQQHFITVFQQRALPEEIGTFRLDAAELEDGVLKLARLLVVLGFAESGSEARRQIGQGAVRLNGVKQGDPGAAILPQEGDIIQVGKRRLARLSLG